VTPSRVNLWKGVSVYKQSVILQTIYHFNIYI